MSTRVSIAKEAQKHLESIGERARETGSGVYDALLDDLLHVIDLLEIHPEMGPAYPLAEGDTTRRVFLERSKHFAYYEYDAARDIVSITSIWYAGRATTPEPRARRKKDKR